jgi:hypothetical protein
VPSASTPATENTCRGASAWPRIPPTTSDGTDPAEKTAPIAAPTRPRISSGARVSTTAEAQTLRLPFAVPPATAIGTRTNTFGGGEAENRERHEGHSHARTDHAGALGGKATGGDGADHDPGDPGRADATSYHLRALERWGIVVRAEPSEDGRERPWRAAGTRFDVVSDDPLATRAAETALVDLALDRDRAAIRSFLAQESEEPPEWLDAIEISVGEPWLTAGELRELTRELRATLDRFHDRRLRKNRPAGSRRVRISFIAAPRGSPPPPGDG